MRTRVLASVGVLLGSLGLPACSESAAAPTTASAQPGTSPTPTGQWTRTVITSPMDEEVIVAAKDFAFPDQQTLIRTVLVCTPATRDLKIALESYALVGSSAGTAVAFATAAPGSVAGTARFGSKEPTPLSSSFALDHADYIAAGHVGSDADADSRPVAGAARRNVGWPGPRLAQLLPIALTLQTEHGTVELAIPSDSTSINGLVSACSGEGRERRAAQVAPAASRSALADAIASPAPNPAPLATVKPSFDCATASSSGERLICANPELAAADADLADYYRRTLAASNAATVGPSQRAFLARRNRCTAVSCVADATRARREELAVLGLVPE